LLSASTARRDRNSSTRPRSLTCGLVSAGPTGTELAIRVDGVTVLQERVGKGPWTATVPLPDQPADAQVVTVEIASDVADGANSVILEQVTNGIAVRMAVLFLVAQANENINHENTD